MDITGVKALAGLVFFVLALAFGWLPFYFFRRHIGATSSVSARSDSKRTVWVQCLHSLASGVMVATCLLHLLPESLSTVRAAVFSECLQQTGDHGVTNVTSLDLTTQANCQCQIPCRTFPIAESLVALGFLLIYVIDSFIHSCSRSKDKAKYSHFMKGLDDLSTATDSETNSLSSSQRLLETNISSQQQTRQQWGTGRKYKRKPSLQLRWSRPKFSTSQREAVARDTSEGQEGNGPPAEIGSVGHNNDVTNMQKQTNDESDSSSFVTAFSASEEHPLASSRGQERGGQSVHLRSVTLVSALCIHGFFDGVMLGLQTSVPVVTSLLLALSIHKSFVAVGLSLTLLGSGNKTLSNRVALLYLFMFACVAPLGLLVSAALLHRTFEGSSSGEVSFVPGCLQSFAVGTFLYVTLSEMLKDGGHCGGAACFLVRHIFLLVGFCVMAALRVFLGST